MRAGAVVVLLVALIVILSGCTLTPKNSEREGFDCLDGGAPEGGYTPGQIAIGFAPDLSKEHIKETLSSLNLSLNDLTLHGESYWGLLEVPPGEENSWACKIKDTGIVTYAELSGFVQVG